MESRLLTFKHALKTKNKVDAKNILIGAPDGELAQLLQAAVRELGSRRAVDLVKEQRTPDEQSVLCELADQGGNKIVLVAEWLAQLKQNGLDALLAASRRGFHSPIASAAKEGHILAVKKMLQLYRAPLVTGSSSPSDPAAPLPPPEQQPQHYNDAQQQQRELTALQWAEVLYGACSENTDANVELARWLLLPEQTGSSPQSSHFRRHPLLALVESIDHPGTALGIAAQQGCCKMLSMLLQWLDARGELQVLAQMGPTVEDYFEWSPIGMAAKKGNKAAVSLMLSALDKAIEQGMAEPLSAEEVSLALVPALQRPHNLPIIKRLLSYPCVDVTLKPCAPRGVRAVNSPMGMAAFTGCVANLAVILAAACERNGGSKELAGVLLPVGDKLLSPLEQAAHRGNSGAVRRLLEHAPLGVGPQELSSSLVLAASKEKNSYTLRELLKHGADPLVPDAGGTSPLDQAKECCPANLDILQEHVRASGPRKRRLNAACSSAQASGGSGQPAMSKGKRPIGDDTVPMPRGGARTRFPTCNSHHRVHRMSTGRGPSRGAGGSVGAAPAAAGQAQAACLGGQAGNGSGVGGSSSAAAATDKQVQAASRRGRAGSIAHVDLSDATAKAVQGQPAPAPGPAAPGPGQSRRGTAGQAATSHAQATGVQIKVEEPERPAKRARQIRGHGSSGGGKRQQRTGAAGGTAAVVTCNSLGQRKPGTWAAGGSCTAAAAMAPAAPGPGPSRPRSRSTAGQVATSQAQAVDVQVKVEELERLAKRTRQIAGHGSSGGGRQQQQAGGTGGGSRAAAAALGPAAPDPGPLRPRSRSPAGEAAITRAQAAAGVPATGKGLQRPAKKAWQDANHGIAAAAAAAAALDNTLMQPPRPRQASQRCLTAFELVQCSRPPPEGAHATAQQPVPRDGRSSSAGEAAHEELSVELQPAAVHRAAVAKARTVPECYAAALAYANATANAARPPTLVAGSSSEAAGVCAGSGAPGAHGQGRLLAPNLELLQTLLSQHAQAAAPHVAMPQSQAAAPHAAAAHAPRSGAGAGVPPRGGDGGTSRVLQDPEPAGPHVAASELRASEPDASAPASDQGASEPTSEPAGLTGRPAGHEATPSIAATLGREQLAERSSQPEVAACGGAAAAGTAAGAATAAGTSAVVGAGSVATATAATSAEGTVGITMGADAAATAAGKATAAGTDAAATVPVGTVPVTAAATVPPAAAPVTPAPPVPAAAAAPATAAPYLYSADLVTLPGTGGRRSVLRFGDVSRAASGAMYAAARKALAGGPLKLVGCSFEEVGPHPGQRLWEVRVEPIQQTLLGGSDAWESTLLEAEEKLLVELPRAGAIAAATGT